MFLDSNKYLPVTGNQGGAVFQSLEAGGNLGALLVDAVPPKAPKWLQDPNGTPKGSQTRLKEPHKK